MQWGLRCDWGTLPGGAWREIWGLLFKDNRSFSVSKGKGCSRLSEEGCLEGSGVRVKASGPCRSSTPRTSDVKQGPFEDGVSCSWLKDALQ